MPAPTKTASNATVNFVSRSRSRHGQEPFRYQKPDRLSVIAEIHQQVPSHLRHPPAIRVGGHAEDPDPAGRMLNDGQDVGVGAVEEVDGEEVRRQDRVGLAAQELRP